MVEVVGVRSAIELRNARVNDTLAGTVSCQRHRRGGGRAGLGNVRPYDLIITVWSDSIQPSALCLPFWQYSKWARSRRTRQSRLCGLKQPERALRVAGMVAVGGSDVGVAVQAQEADGQATQRCHHSGRVSGPDQ